MKQIFTTPNKALKVVCVLPALLSFQQLPVGGNLDVQGHLDIEEVLILTKVAGHLVLHVMNVVLQTGNSVLVTGRLHGEVLLRLPHLPLQGFILGWRPERSTMVLNEPLYKRLNDPPMRRIS